MLAATRRAFLASVMLFAAGCGGVPASEPSDEAVQPASLDGAYPLSMGLVRLDATAVPEPEPEYCDAESPEVPSPDLRLYATWQSFPLQRAEHGIDGTLRVLQDSRFTVRGADRSGTHPMLKPCDPLPGRIEVLDADGHVVDAWTESPQIDVTAHAFAPGQTLYQVRSRVHCLASCWCGDAVRFVRVVERRLANLATERASGKVLPVRAVTQGCYASGGIERGPDGRPEVRIHRTILNVPDALVVDETHFWDGAAWRGTVVERRMPW